MTWSARATEVSAIVLGFMVALMGLGDCLNKHTGGISYMPREEARALTVVSPTPIEAMDARPTSWETALRFTLLHDAPGGCVDFDGDGELDNAFSVLINHVGDPLLREPLDFNARLQEEIDSGELALMLVVSPRGKQSDDGLLSDGPVDVALLRGAHLEGALAVDPMSLDPITHEPLVVLHGALEDGRLTAASPDDVFGGPLLVPGTLTPTTDTLVIDAQTTLDPEGRLAGLRGSIAGIVTGQSYARLMSARVREECPCMGSAFIQTTQGKVRCAAAVIPMSACECGTVFCLEMNALCRSGLPYLTSQFDIDQDGDGHEDAFSSGFRFEAAQAPLCGVRGSVECDRLECGAECDAPLW